MESPAARRAALLVLAASLALLLAACSALAEPAPPTPTAASASAARSTPASGATTPPADATPAPASSTPAADPTPGSVRITFGPGTEARYRATEQLVGRGVNEAVGRTTAISGGVVLDRAGAVVSEQSQIVVDLRTLKSDESRRDNWLQRNTIQTDRFPTATFVVRGVRGLPFPLPTSGAATFELVGDLTVRDVTRPLTWQVQAQFRAAEITGLATTDLRLTDFGLTPPTVGPVLSIADPIKLELQFTAVRAPGAGAGGLLAGTAARSG